MASQLLGPVCHTIGLTASRVEFKGKVMGTAFELPIHTFSIIFN